MLPNGLEPQELVDLMKQLYAKKGVASTPRFDQLSNRLVSAWQDVLDTSGEMHNVLASQFCGIDDSVGVEEFADAAKMAPKLVMECAAPVAEIRWIDNLAERFASPGDTPGNVAGRSWGTGVLVDTDLMLTAGHLFDPVDGGVKHPTRGLTDLPPEELAKLMSVRFNFQLDPSGKPRETTTFPVVELVEREQVANVIDYALIRLGPDVKGQSASKLFGVATLSAPETVAKDTELLCIQHRCTANGATCDKAGVPKRVAFGAVVRNGGPFINHLIDTKSGASGAPVLTKDGRVVGIQIQGLCDLAPRVNKAILINAIVDRSARVSALVHP